MKSFKKMLNTIYIILFILSSSMAILANVLKSVDLMEKSLLLMCITAIIFCLNGFRQKLILLLFELCIFTFQIAKVMMGYFFNEEGWNFGLFNNELIIGLNILFLALFFLIIGFNLGKSWNKKIKFEGIHNSVESIVSDNNFSILGIQSVTLAVYCISLILSIAMNISKMRYALAYGYISLYTSYTSIKGYSWFQLIYTATLFIGLAAYPSNRRKWFYLITGTFVPLVALIQGSRGGFACYIIFVFYYLYEYDDLMQLQLSRMRQKKKFIRWAIIIGFSAVIILPSLYNYGHTRADQNHMVSLSIFDGIKNFFYEESGSFNLIKYAIIYDGQLPQKLYSLGSIVDLLKGTLYTGQTVESALYGHSFGNVITYMVTPAMYLSGYGYGSSYLAEVYYDFGYIGVIIINLFFGVLFYKYTQWEKNGIFINAIYFFVMYYILLLPRFSLLYPLNNLLSKSVIVTFIFVFFIGRKRVRIDIR